MSRTENAAQEHQDRAAMPAAPTFPLGVEPGTHAEARELARVLPPWAAYAVMAFWLDGQEEMEPIEAMRAAGYLVPPEMEYEIRLRVARATKHLSEIMTVSGIDWRMP